MKEMLILTTSILVVICIVFVGYEISISRSWAEDSRFACEARGGSWITGPINYDGKPYYAYCKDRIWDEGKSCTEDSDCSDACAVNYPVQKNSEGYVMGKCTKYSIDTCPQTLPKKVRSEAELKMLGISRSCA